MQNLPQDIMHQIYGSFGRQNGRNIAALRATSLAWHTAEQSLPDNDRASVERTVGLAEASSALRTGMEMIQGRPDLMLRVDTTWETFTVYGKKVTRAYPAGRRQPSYTSDVEHIAPKDIRILQVRSRLDNSDFVTLFPVLLRPENAHTPAGRRRLTRHYNFRPYADENEVRQHILSDMHTSFW